MNSNLWKDKDELQKFIKNLSIEYRYGCYENKNFETCHLLGDYFMTIDKEREKAELVYKMNCDDNKFAMSCDSYGRSVFRRSQASKEPQYELALEYFEKGCEYGDPRACYNAGQMYGVNDKRFNSIIKPDPEKAIGFLQKACVSKNQPKACTLVHSFYLRGCHGMPPDLKKSAEYAMLACDQGELMSCHNISRMYKIGEGVEANEERSKYYKQRAKEIEGCLKYSTEHPNAKPDA